MSTWTQGELPYAGTSGYAAGSPTSEARARHDDETGVTSKRQREVLERVAARGPEGATWRELADETGWHHGQVTAPLSVLHMTGHLARLAEGQRMRCAVYVLPEYVDGRGTEAQGHNRRAGALLTVAQLSAALRAQGLALEVHDRARLRNALRALGITFDLPPEADAETENGSDR